VSSFSNQGRQALISTLLVSGEPEFSPLDELEVSYRIGDIGLGAFDACVVKCAIQNAARRAHKRLSGNVVFVAGLFADKHRWSRYRSSAEHGLRGRFPEFARAAVGSFLGGISPLRKDVVGTHFKLSAELSHPNLTKSNDPP
jgi:hypothetical protein